MYVRGRGAKVDMGYGLNMWMLEGAKVDRVEDRGVQCGLFSSQFNSNSMQAKKKLNFKANFNSMQEIVFNKWITNFLSKKEALASS